MAPESLTLPPFREELVVGFGLADDGFIGVLLIIAKLDRGWIDTLCLIGNLMKCGLMELSILIFGCILVSKVLVELHALI